MSKRIAKEIIDHGCGFPVRLTHVPMVEVQGEWVPKIDHNKLAKQVLLVLSHLARPLTGHEVRFVRQHFAMTLAEFGAKFGLSHVAVLNWEKKGDKPTAMQWSTEKDLRLFIQSRISKDMGEIGRLYAELAEKPAAEASKPKPIGPIEARELIAA